MKRAWRATAGARRPVALVVDRAVGRLLRPHLTGPASAVGRLEQEVRSLSGIADQLSGETNLMLDTLLREVGRLREQVGALQEELAERRREECEGPRARVG
jgi:hypothetical protein